MNKIIDYIYLIGGKRKKSKAVKIDLPNSFDLEKALEDRSLQKSDYKITPILGNTQIFAEVYLETFIDVYSKARDIFPKIGNWQLYDFLAGAEMCFSTQEAMDTIIPRITHKKGVVTMNVGIYTEKRMIVSIPGRLKYIRSSKSSLTHEFGHCIHHVLSPEWWGNSTPFNKELMAIFFQRLLGYNNNNNNNNNNPLNKRYHEEDFVHFDPLTSLIKLSEQTDFDDLPLTERWELLLDKEDKESIDDYIDAFQARPTIQYIRKKVEA